MTDAVEIVGEVGSALTGRQNRKQGIALEQNITTFAGWSGDGWLEVEEKLLFVSKT